MLGGTVRDDERPLRDGWGTVKDGEQDGIGMGLCTRVVSMLLKSVDWRPHRVVEDYRRKAQMRQ